MNNYPSYCDCAVPSPQGCQRVNRLSRLLCPKHDTRSVMRFEFESKLAVRNIGNGEW